MKDSFNTWSLKTLDERSQMFIDLWTFIVWINLSKWHRLCYILSLGYSAWRRVLQCIESIEFWSLIQHGLKNLYYLQTEHDPSKCCNHKPIRWNRARRRTYPPLPVLWGKGLTFVFPGQKGMVTYQQMLFSKLKDANDELH